MNTSQRLKRVKRWIKRSGTDDDSSSVVDLTFDGPLCKKSNQDLFIERTCRANLLFKREIAWLCDYATDTTGALRREERNQVQLAIDLENERVILDDVSEWAQAEIDGLRATVANLRRECAIRENVEFRLREKLEASQAEVRRLEMECSK